MSRVSLGNLIDFQNDLKKSQMSNLGSSINLQRVELPQLNPEVARVKENLKVLEPKNKGNLVFEGPYVYSTGVYYGQFDNKRRRYGFY
jgi:hypothetical protein